jgi:uncharacterized delta-60 repeat protein
VRCRICGALAYKIGPWLHFQEREQHLLPFCMKLRFCLAACAVIFMSIAAYAQPGRILPSNPLPGSVTPIGSEFTFSPTVIFDEFSGSTTVWGTCHVGLNYFDMCATRVLASGARDLSFGQRGMLVLTRANINSIIDKVARLDDGTYVLSGRCGGGVCLARVSLEGQHVLTFGVNGWVDLTSQYVYATITTSANRVVLATACGTHLGNTTYCLEALSAGGSIDTAFGTNGRVNLPHGSPSSISQVATDSAGRIVIGGSCIANNLADCIVRYTGLGAIDLTFGDSGYKRAFRTSRGFNVSALATGADGKLLAAGGCSRDLEYGICISRFSSSSGALDESFGNAGDQFIAIENAYPVALQIRADESSRLIAFAQTNPAIVEFSPPGVPTVHMRPESSATFVAPPYTATVTANGKYLFAGSTYNSVGFILTRLLRDATPDPQFDGDGAGVAVSGDRYFSTEGAHTVSATGGGWVGVIDCDHTRPGDTAAQNVKCVSRHSEQGEQITTFGTNSGWAYVQAGSRDSNDARVATDQAGSVFVLAECVGTNSSTTTGLCVSKLTAGGWKNAEFGVDGVSAMGSLPLGRARGIEIDRVGRAVIVGICYLPDAEHCVTRLTLSGAIDRSFGVDGIAAFELPTNAEANPLAVLRVGSDNSLFVGGTCTDPVFWNVACVIKLSPDGQTDLTFGQSGISGVNVVSRLLDFDVSDQGIVLMFACNGTTCLAKLDIGGSPIGQSFASVGEPGWGDGYYRLDRTGANTPLASRLMRQPDGRILLAGACYADIDAMCVVRLLASGEKDLAFGINGVSVVIANSQSTRFSSALLTDHGVIVVSALCSDFQSAFTEFSRTRHACYARIASRASAFFDINNDYRFDIENDAVGYQRFLLGFQGESLLPQGPQKYATRVNGSSIAAHLTEPSSDFNNCSSSIVGAPGGPSALVDGLVLLRIAVGLTEGAVTAGVVFPDGSLRTSWSAIREHLVSNCGLVLQ